MERQGISAGTACFLVKDDSLILRWESPFVKWLIGEGFESVGKGYWDGVTWIYINLNAKVYMPGMPGISVTTPIGGCAITSDEFKNIYHILKKNRDGEGKCSCE